MAADSDNSNAGTLSSLASLRKDVDTADRSPAGGALGGLLTTISGLKHAKERKRERGALDLARIVYSNPRSSDEALSLADQGVLQVASELTGIKPGSKGKGGQDNPLTAMIGNMLQMGRQAHQQSRQALLQKELTGETGAKSPTAPSSPAPWSKRAEPAAQAREQGAGGSQGQGLFLTPEQAMKRDLIRQDIIEQARIKYTAQALEQAEAIKNKSELTRNQEGYDQREEFLKKHPDIQGRDRTEFLLTGKIPNAIPKAEVTKDVARPGFEGAWTRIRNADGSEEWLQEAAKPATQKPTPLDLLTNTFLSSGQAKTESEARQQAASLQLLVERAKLKLTEARTKAAQQGGASIFTPQEMQALAKWGVLTGQNPSFGLSANNPDRKLYYKAYANEIMGGGGAGGAASERATYKGTAASLADIQKLRGRVVSFEETARQNIDRAVLRGRSVGRTGSSLINDYLLNAQGKLEDYPELAKFRTDIQTAANEYARVVNSATGNGVSTDAARAEAMRIFNDHMAQGSLEGAAQEMQLDMDSRVNALDQTIQGLRQGLETGVPPGGGAGAPGTLKPAAPGAPAAGGTSKVVDDLLKDYGGRK